MMRYASDTSLQAPRDPGGSDRTIIATVENVPHVHGYKSVSMVELIELIPLKLRGYERFWIRRNLPGLPAFGTKERGDV